jgi:hypothetical protein
MLPTIGWRQRFCLWLLCAVTGALALVIARPDALPVVAQEGVPARFTLPVNLRAQETEVWCWAATGQMTMEYFGTTISQSEQANLLFRRDDCGRRPVPGPCVRGGDVVLRPFGFSHDLSRAPLSEDEIVRQIFTLRKPLPFSWVWPGGGGHAALVVGYAQLPDRTFLVECLDPYPPAGKDPRSMSGGHRTFIPYRRWVAGAEHSFGGVLFNITKNP